MKYFKLLAFALSITFFACQNKGKEASKTKQSIFYVGTYTSERIQDSESEGIYTYALNNDGTIDAIGLAVKTNSPSFITKSINNKFIIGTNSNNNGSITSFKIDGNVLQKISQSKTGDNPCYVTSNKDNYVLTANYNSGNYNLHQLAANGVLSSALDTHKSTFTIPSTHSRQDAPHAHSCYFEPNSNNIIAIDLGTNKLIFEHIEEVGKTIEPNEFSELQMPKHCGPRILTFHPTQPWLYVVNELDATITFIKKNRAENSYEIVATVDTLKPEDKKGNSAAHIQISNDGNYVYMSNRGHDSIGVLKILPSGQLEVIQTMDTHGKHPRHFTLSPNDEFLIVANRDDNSICSFARDAKTGKLSFVAKTNAPKPVCLVF